MTNQEILEKAMQKAIDGGWNHWWTGDFLTTKAKERGAKQAATYLSIEEDHVCIRWSNDNIPLEDSDISIAEIIFNHDFAKALWGEHTETMTVQNNTLNVKQVIDMDGWRYHLQQMVVAKDPIKYLGDNI